MNENNTSNYPKFTPKPPLSDQKIQLLQDLRNCHKRSLGQGTAMRSLECRSRKEREGVGDSPWKALCCRKVVLRLPSAPAKLIAHHLVGKLRKRAERVIADRGYDADLLIELIEQQGAQAVIPPRKNRKQPRDYDRHWYKKRHLIECLFNKIKQYRRVFSRFDKLARNYWSFLCFVCALLWLR